MSVVLTVVAGAITLYLLVIYSVMKGGRCTSSVNMKGKTAIVTGYVVNTNQYSDPLYPRILVYLCIQLAVLDCGVSIGVCSCLPAQEVTAVLGKPPLWVWPGEAPESSWPAATRARARLLQLTSAE